MQAVEKRIRRTPEQAQRVILDAAEACLGVEGPAGLRLTQVAAAAGVSHPTLLHHFGSREGLLRALYRRALGELKERLVAVMQDARSSGEDVTGVVFAAYRNGLAQRLVWMMQADQDADPPDGLPILDALAAELHALRIRLAPGIAIDEADTRAIVHLTAVAAFGDALIGARLRAAGTMEDEAASRRRFELWFGGLLNQHVAAAMAPRKDG